MKIIFYEVKEKPKEMDVPKERLAGLVGGELDVEEMICGTCVVWFKNAPIPKDRSKYHRNVYITKQINGEIKAFQTPIYSSFFLCGYRDGNLTDFPQKCKRGIMAMFGF